MKKILFSILIIFFNNNTLAEDKMEIGEEIYKNKAMCVTCHTLKEAGSISEIGPNLDGLKPQLGQIIYAVTNGIGVMPPWSDILTVEEIESVSFYVFNSTNK